MRVLVVEDDHAIAVPLAQGLERAGFEPVHVDTGAAALEADDVDVVLLDLGLPDMDGIDVCRAMRERSAVPIIVVSARGDEVDRVVGLEVGADDYVVKPFGLRELVARIRAVMRRVGDGPGSLSDDDEDDRTQVGALVVDRRAHRVAVADDEVALTPTEFDILEVLARDPGAVVRRSELLDEVWGGEWYGPTKTIDVHVAALRRKLGHADWIETVRGVGFRLGDIPVDP